MNLKNDNQNINLVLKTAEDDSKSLKVSIFSVFSYMRKFLLVWVLVAAILASCVCIRQVWNFKKKATVYPPVSTLISFSHSGVEKGLDPLGNILDVNIISSPRIIEAALVELDYDMELIDKVRKNLKIEGIIPDDAINKITAYQSVFESKGDITSAEKLIATTYFPTQYKISLSYASTDLNFAEAKDLLDEITNSYRRYYIQTYGYNRAFGEAVSNVDYEAYDYSEAVQLFSDSLTSIERYVYRLSNEDKTRFRSTETGYTFTDLLEKTRTIRSINLDRISSYITVNNVTKDKDRLVKYYEYKIEADERAKATYSSTVETLKMAMEMYQKDAVVVPVGDSVSAPITQNSKQYDDFFSQMIDAQRSFDNCSQNIAKNKARIESLNSQPTGTASDKQKVEAELLTVSETVNGLIELINKTADEYYEKVAFSNSFSVIVPASGTEPKSPAQAGLSTKLRPAYKKTVMYEAALFFMFVGAAFAAAWLAALKKSESEALAVEGVAETEENAVKNDGIVKETASVEKPADKSSGKKK